MSRHFCFVYLGRYSGNNNSWGNNLAYWLYIYSGVVKITCKQTNPRYMSYNGAVYSKDGSVLYYAPMLSTLHKDSSEKATLEIKEGTSEIFFGALGCDSSFKGNYVCANNLDSNNMLKSYDKLYIPASVTKIDATTLEYINLQPWEIEIASENSVYAVKTTTSGKTTKYEIVEK